MSILLYNARIHANEDAEWLLIRNNIIEKLGKGNLPTASRKIDLGHYLILPGFCDSHTHLMHIALMRDVLDLTGKSREEILRVIRGECPKRKRIIGRGWDESLWKEKRYLTSEELDSACPDRIVVMIREDGHLATVNSYAARKFGVNAEEGVIRERDVEKVVKKAKIWKNIDLDFAQDYALGKGITCVHDFANLKMLKRYMTLRSTGRLRIRVYLNFYSSTYRYIRHLGLYSGFGDDFLRIGALKLFADGSIGAGTAATRYSDGNVVEPMLKADEIRKIVEKANSAGIRVFTHAIGDLAIDEVIKAYKNTGGNRIEHFELVKDNHIEELRGMDVEISMQPNFLKWAKADGLYHRMLGERWLKSNNPYRKILKNGLKLLFGSDCMPLDPLFGIRMATESEYEEQRIPFKDAVIAYSRGSRYMNPMLGEIKEGYIADLTVIRDDRVYLTIVDGKILYAQE